MTDDGTQKEPNDATEASEPTQAIDYDQWDAANAADDPTATTPVAASSITMGGTASTENGGRAAGWWRVPVALLAVLALLVLVLGLAAGNDGDGDDVASVATSSSSSSSTSSSSTILFTTQTTVPIIATTSLPVATTALPAITTPTTAASSATTRATTAPAANRPLQIEVRYTPKEAAVGQTVTFNVTANDPDASPIREGACGTGNGVSFGDGAGHPTSCSASCPSGLSGTSSAGSSAFTYTHAYGAPGIYTVSMTYASGDRCTTRTASVRTITFQITVR